MCSKETDRERERVCVCWSKKWENAENTSWTITFQRKRFIIIAKISGTAFNIVGVPFLLVHFTFQGSSAGQIVGLIQTAV